MHGPSRDCKLWKRPSFLVYKCGAGCGAFRLCFLEVAKNCYSVFIVGYSILNSFVSRADHIKFVSASGSFILECKFIPLFRED
ncbi:unnamed protein product [Moneuplotes crassus]|uniref:Uncharacterized protein n=1 Tax=Euplotes crassus TaxID=5936 RepID=A0AAD1UDA2_EUPCR|nr:unnamed protein product [Moneuplotes crassus]